MAEPRVSLVTRRVIRERGVDPGQPFRIAETTARRARADGVAQGIQTVGLLAALMGNREQRRISKIRNRAEERELDRQEQLRDIFAQSVTQDPSTGRFVMDEEGLLGTMAASGFGQETLQLQAQLDKRDQAQRNVQRVS